LKKIGYIADLRNHPAINYYRSGIPIVLGSDDPGAFGFNELTVDYYLAYMGWGLDLYDLKVIANNSLKHSLVSEETRQAVGFPKFEAAWTYFINTMYESVCELHNLVTNDPKRIRVRSVLPLLAPAAESADVTVRGVGFESTFCKRILCLFGHVRTLGLLVSIDEIRCKSPANMIDPSETVHLSLQIDNFILDSGFKFTFF
jgi:adenosine deaminase CECR1